MNAPQRLSPWARHALRFHRYRTEHVHIMTATRRSKKWRVVIVRVPHRGRRWNGC